MIALASLLWLLHKQEVDEQRNTLIIDTLWVEQNLHFQLTRSKEQLQQVMHEYFNGDIPGELLDSRIRDLMANNPGLQQVLLLDDGGSVLRSSIGLAEQTIAGEGLRPEATFEALRLARASGNPVFSPPYADATHHLFDIVVPEFKNDIFIGSAVGTFAIRELLGKQVPWWFAQKYRLSVTNAEGVLLGAKSNVETGEESLSYMIPFDPPGHGLVLVATSYKVESGLIPNLLAVVIVGLGGGILISLWALRQHVQRRLAAELALSKEHAFRKAMEDSLFTGLRARDLEGRIIYVNPAFCRITGFSAEELIGLGPPMPYWAPEELESTLTAHRKVLAGQAPSEGVEVRLQRKNGERFDALIYEAPLIDAEGRHTGWMGSVLDVTERKRAEELARQQQEKLQLTARLVTMGEMASTLAHELNQPLSAISSYTTGCINRLEAGDLPRNELREALGKLAAQAQRAGRVIRRVYDFVRRSEPKRAHCAINEIVDDAVGLIEADARKHGVRIALRLAERPPLVMADRVMLEQVLLNLMRNGIEAMQAAEPEHRQLTVGTELADGCLLVSVADRGSGVAQEAAAHLFEPFFSTKPEGMGMGLNICRSIIEFHQGRLWADANSEGGTVFRFTLPIEPA